MLTTKLVVRVMDADLRLLAWTEVQGEARGDGALWVKAPTLAGVEAAGVPAWLSVHWADVNVEARSRFDHRAVSVGEVLTLAWPSAPILTVGPMPEALPPVTVRAPIRVAMPVGALGAVAG